MGGRAIQMLECHKWGVRTKYYKGGSGFLRRHDIFENVKTHFLLTFRQSHFEVRVRQNLGKGWWGLNLGLNILLLNVTGDSFEDGETDVVVTRRCFQLLS